MGRRAKATERTGVLERWSAKAITEDEKRWVRATLQRIARRGAERRDRQVGSQVQDRAGQPPGSRGKGEEGTQEHDAQGTAGGAYGCSDAGQQATVTKGRRTHTERMAEETGERPAPG